MTDLTPDRLQELRRIAEAATPGPLTMHLCDGARYAAFVDAPHLGPDAPELAVFLTERDARFFAEFDRDTVLAMLDEIERLRREREEDDDKWTRYEELYVQARGQIVDLQLEIERLRRERKVLAEALKAVRQHNKHVHTCDHCECALCPEGTGLSYGAYRALGEAMDLLDGEKGGGDDGR